MGLLLHSCHFLSCFVGRDDRHNRGLLHPSTQPAGIAGPVVHDEGDDEVMVCPSVHPVESDHSGSRGEVFYPSI